MGDTGLLMSQFEEGDIKTFLQGDLGIYKGTLYENITAQILQRLQKKCYYYEPSQTSEIDFIIYYDGEITPIEVKEGRKYEVTFFTKLCQCLSACKCLSILCEKCRQSRGI